MNSEQPLSDVLRMEMSTVSVAKCNQELFGS